MVQDVILGAHRHNLYLVYHKLGHFISTLVAVTWVASVPATILVVLTVVSLTPNGFMIEQYIYF